jgi:hypothetical protein
MRDLDLEMRRLERTRAMFDGELAAMRGRLQSVAMELAQLHRRIADLQSTASWSRYRQRVSLNVDR